MTGSIPTDILFTILAILLLISAFFSGSETGIMSINRYRLKHKAKSNKKAKRVLKLLSRPDRLLAVILIGNNFINISASAIATLIGVRLMGDMGVLAATILLTIAILIFSEITPKTLAALRPEKVAFLAALPLQVLLVLMFPLVLCANGISNGLLRIVGIRSKGRSDSLTVEELRTVVNEASTLIPTRHQEMLTSILDLERMTVEDIMIPRTEVVGIDLEDDESAIQAQLRSTQHTLLPIFEGDLDNVQGIIHMRDLSRHLTHEDFSASVIRRLLQTPYFVPEGTSLHTQLFNFQRNKHRFALIVDEYGDILGLITLEDILEEIVGEFTTDVTSISQEVTPQDDNSYIVDGGANIRALNRTLRWELPIDGPKTVSGAIVEHLEMIPSTATCVLLNNYPIEILQVQDNMIKTCRIFPRLSPNNHNHT